MMLRYVEAIMETRSPWWSPASAVEEGGERGGGASKRSSDVIHAESRAALYVRATATVASDWIGVESVKKAEIPK